MEENEQGNLIGSDKVEGTAVYGADDQKIGSIERVMIDKMSGKVSYAVLVVTEDKLKGAPKYASDTDWSWGDPTKARSVNDYYGVPY